MKKRVNVCGVQVKLREAVRKDSKVKRVKEKGATKARADTREFHEHQLKRIFMHREKNL